MSARDYYFERWDCRICGVVLPDKRLIDFGETPLANEFRDAPTAPEDVERFPLYLQQCEGCGHVQLPVVVDPLRLFSSYCYVSGTSPVFVEHFRGFYDAHIPFVRKGDLVVEAGSNDGTLLRMFARGAHARVLGVDPAREIAKRASDDGVPTMPNLFTEAAAREIVREHGNARLVIANNVFAHTDDLRGFARAVAHVLDRDGGRFVFEVQYLGDLIERGHWDNIYHEHTSYHHIGPLERLLRDAGLGLAKVERVETHGGSIRCTAKHASSEVFPIIDDSFVDFERSASRLNFNHVLGDMGLKRDAFHKAFRPGEKVVGYGAPAKATTFMQALGLEDRFAYIVDDSPHKQGRVMPQGTIPVLPSKALMTDPPHVVVVLAWNFADSIVKRLAPFLEGGAGRRVIVPAPHFRTIESPIEA